MNKLSWKADNARQYFDNLEQEVEETNSALEVMAMIDIADIHFNGHPSRRASKQIKDVKINIEQLDIQIDMNEGQLTAMLNEITNTRIKIRYFVFKCISLTRQYTGQLNKISDSEGSNKT